MPRRLVFAAIALTLMAVMVAGCSKRKYTLDPSYTLPEGIPSSELELITFFDAPNNKIRVRDRGQVGRVDVGFDPATVDSIQRDPDTGALLITPIQAFSPGTVRGIVLNRTGAEGIEVYRTDASGAVRRIFDFAVQPTRRWLDRNAEIYEFYDDDPSRVSGATYYVRGMIGGIGGPNSPLSNASRPVPTAIAEIRYTAQRWGTFAGSYFDADSLIEMRWTPVGGTSRYLIQVFEYQARTLSLRDRVLTGAPSPILTLGQRDIFVATVPGTTTEYKMGDPGAVIYTFRAPRMRLDYYVRISAIDANGQLIAMTTGVPIDETRDLNQLFRWPRDNTVKDFFADFADPEVVGASPAAYLLYSRGAAWVSPGADPQPPSAMERLR